MLWHLHGSGIIGLHIKSQDRVNGKYFAMVLVKIKYYLRSEIR